MKPHRVLVTAVGGNIGQGVIKALRAAKRPFFIVGIDMERLSAGFSLADRYYGMPRTTDPAFKRELESIARNEALEAIYVCSPTELEFFSSHKEQLERELSLTVLVNPVEIVRIGSDKLKTANFLREVGLPSLKTVLATDEEGLDRIITELGFPLIVKPRAGFSSRNVFVLNSREEIRAASRLIPELVVQEYLPDFSSEYTAATLSGSDGKVRASIILHRDLIQGTTYRTELVQNEHLGDQVARIVNALGAIGICNLQFRLVNETVFVFEANPRFSGSCGIRYLYGFNEAEMAFELLRLGLDVQQPELRPAVVLRYWNEIFISGASFQTLRDGRHKHSGTQTIIH
jgi:carbamoyl-phosphate synthase large subunit